MSRPTGTWTCSVCDATGRAYDPAAALEAHYARHHRTGPDDGSHA